jgi:hypothetical protein
LEGAGAVEQRPAAQALGDFARFPDGCCGGSTVLMGGQVFGVVEEAVARW